jgi:SAM-dependent methyltransferase
MEAKEARIIGAPDSHDTLVRTLRNHAPCRILDAPAGMGVLAEQLREWGYDVHCADIDPGNFKSSDFPFTQVDLNRNIDLPSESFDAVVCANGIHRLYNLSTCLSEFARVLKPNGKLWINVNNYAAIDRRIRFLFYGSLDNAVNGGHCNQTTDAPEANVRIALHVPFIVNQLEAAGLELISIKPAAVRTVDRLLAPLGLLVRLLSYLVPPSSQRRSRLRWTRCGGVLPGGRYMMLEARKPKN